MKKVYFLISLLCLSFITYSQVVITNVATPYSQDFNTLDAAATTTPSNVLPLGWSIVETGTSSLVDQKYKSDNGGLNSGDTYSYGATSATERALGSIQSGTLASSFGVKFQNNSGVTITSLTVTYTGEQWRLGTAGRADTLDFKYGINNTDLGTGTFTDVDNLDFISPNTTGAAGALDGNIAGNKTSITFTISSLNIAAGDFFYLKFVDRNITGSDDGLGIDDMTVTFNGSASTPCTEPTTQPTALSLTPAATSITGSFTAASPVPNNYLVVYSTSSTLSAQPADGTSYTVGQALGGGVVGAISATNSFTINSLTAGTLYYVFIYSLNNIGCSGGPNYLTSAPLQGNTTTVSIPGCVAPALPATALLLTPTSNTINGSFTASATANKYLVVRSTTNTLSAAPVNGTTYISGASFGGGTIIQFGAATTFSSVGLTANTVYYYFVFAANGGCTGEPFYLLPALLGNVTTLNTTATGYYNGAAGLSCQALKTALYNITSSGTTVLSYTPGVWNAYQTTDLTRNFANTTDIIYDMYSNKGPGIAEPYQFIYGTNQCGNYSGEGNCYNREHSFPKSWFGDVPPMNTDIHHVVPTDGYVNGQRGNFAYGPVGTAIYTSQNGTKKGNCSYPGFTGTVFEPINEFKGDFARMQLYMAVRYENLIASWQNLSNANDVLNGSSYQVFDDWYIKMLYDWHQLDPVSAKEIARNNAVYAIQGNRNPFIDSAQYVYKIWGCIPGLLPSNVPPPNPTSINVSNKCQSDATAKGKLTNPPLGTTIAITIDNVATPYNAVDSSFVYFTNGATTLGAHNVLITYTNAIGSTQLTIPFIVSPNTTPTITASGNSVVLIGQSSTISTAITNGGSAPIYQWQDSTNATGWQNIAIGTSNSINYSPIATGNKLRCKLTSNGTCTTTTQATSNVITFTVNTVTAINTVTANNFGIQLFPNPVKNSINLYSLKLSDKWLSASIVSINGKNNIIQKNIQNLTSIQIGAANLPSGIYYIILKRTNAKSAYIKFIKM